MRLVALFGLVALSSCAPMMVTRTPEPAAPGTFEVTASAGYPVSLTTPLCDQPDFDGSCYEQFGSSAAYYPLGAPVSVMVSQGLEGRTELNYTGALTGLFGLPVFRLGGKTLFYDEAVKLAADYGVFAGFTNAGLDVGLLASTPLEGAELYGAIRGFGNLDYNGASDSIRSGGFSGLTGALTFGVEAEVAGVDGLFVELTFATSNYNGVSASLPSQLPPYDVTFLDVQQVGFSILPAIGIRF